MIIHRLNIRSGLARRFVQEQDGAGAVLGIFIFMAVVLIGGVALDGTNLWRHQQLLKQTADVAAHAGTVELAKGNSADEAYDRARAFVEQNMPSTWYGNLFGNPAADIRVVHYDPDSDTLDITGPQNAVLVQLHRNGNSQNPVPTFMLRLADVLTMGVVTDVSDWNVYTAGVTAFVGTKKCVSTDGLYARGELNLTSSSSFGSGYCLHSQDKIWMPQQNHFADRAGLSMPNLDACGSKCDDAANPGATAASFERNLIMEDLSQHLENVEQSFLGTSDTTIRDEFFQNKPVGDLSPLAAIGVDTSTISQRGETVNLSQSDFEALTAVPSGLTYNVSCTGGGKEIQFGTPNGKVKPSFGGGTVNVSDIAVITNCALDFGSDSRVESSVILTNLESSNASINASSGAQVGTSGGMCDPDAQSTILGKSDMHVPADFAGSNVSFVVDGDIHLSASSSSTTINHSGISLHASGEIKVAANHTFDPCNNPPSGLMPALKVIRHVEPTGNKFATTATN
ncbi:TadE/TadG family type IV pilus assembly protein [Roseovarius sp.]|uniref:TadE/TadG family type IV pilus assembly protein n=2 Tax=Roseovarius TaxID=74030 RepID=UPI0035665984